MIMTAKELAEKDGISYEAAKKRLQRDRKGQGTRNVPSVPANVTDGSIEMSLNVPAYVPDVWTEISRLSEKLAAALALVEVQGKEVSQLTRWINEESDRLTALEMGAEKRVYGYSGSVKSLDLNHDWGA